MRVAACLLSLVCLSGLAAAPHEPILGGPCEGCENVFVGMPELIAAWARIAPVDAKGEPLVLEGTVRNAAGVPVEGIVVYAYHTDAGGIYPKSITRHGSLRGWARSDAYGMYRFETIRPASYPDSDIPQHIHMHVIEPGKGTYFIDDVHFDDDSLLTDDYKRSGRSGRGGSGVTHPQRDAQGEWQVRRDIVLGERVPGYRP